MALEQDLDGVACLDHHLTLGAGELRDRNLSFGLVTDIYNCKIFVNLNDGAFDNVSFFEESISAALFERSFKHRRKIFITFYSTGNADLLLHGLGVVLLNVPLAP